MDTRTDRLFIHLPCLAVLEIEISGPKGAYHILVYLSNFLNPKKKERSWRPGDNNLPRPRTKKKKIIIRWCFRDGQNKMVSKLSSERRDEFQANKISVLWGIFSFALSLSFCHLVVIWSTRALCAYNPHTFLLLITPHVIGIIDISSCDFY